LRKVVSDLDANLDEEFGQQLNILCLLLFIEVLFLLNKHCLKNCYTLVDVVLNEYGHELVELSQVLVLRILGVSLHECIQLLTYGVDGVLSGDRRVDYAYEFFVSCVHALRARIF
jgi:hypothetical protein